MSNFFFRAFEFLAALLNEIGQGDKTLVDAVSKAYEQSLRRYHGLLARHVFSVRVNQGYILSI